MTPVLTAGVLVLDPGVLFWVGELLTAGVLTPTAAALAQERSDKTVKIAAAENIMLEGVE